MLHLEGLILLFVWMDCEMGIFSELLEKARRGVCWCSRKISQRNIMVNTATGTPNSYFKEKTITFDIMLQLVLALRSLIIRDRT